MILSEEQAVVCGVFSRRDSKGYVHCPDCPMVLDKKNAACISSVTEEDARQWFDWDGNPYPALERRD